MVATDQRVDFAFLRFNVQVDAIFRKSRFLVGAFLDHCLGLLAIVQLFCACDRPALAKGGVLRHTVGNKVDGVIAGHFLLLQEVRGVRFPLGKDRDKDVGAGHLCTAG